METSDLSYIGTLQEVCTMCHVIYVLGM